LIYFFSGFFCFFFLWLVLRTHAGSTSTGNKIYSALDSAGSSISMEATTAVASAT